MNMSGFESNYPGGGHENNFESIIKGAGLENGVVPPELRVPRRCSTCPALCDLRAELSNAASRLQPWAEQVMEAQERLDEVAEQFPTDEDIQYLAANVLKEARQDATDKLALLEYIAEAAQETADDMTKVCDGPVAATGVGGRSTVSALFCDSDIVNQPGSFSMEKAYVLRGQRRSGFGSVLSSFRRILHRSLR